MERTAKNKPKASPRKSDRIIEPRLRFKELRMVKGSHGKVSRDLNISEATIRKVEYGQLDPSFLMAFVYASYLEASVEELFPDVVSEARKYYGTLSVNFAL